MKPSIAIIGAGGLAVTAAWELADKLASHGYSLKIYDEDKIELSNLNRQILFSKKDIGLNKSEILASRLRERFKNSEISNLPYHINKNNIENELGPCCAVLDATDSARTSFLLNGYCVKNLKTFAFAGVVGDYGQSLIVNPALPSPCLRCIFGNWQEQDFSEIELTCQNAGIIGPVAGYLGLIQAQLLIQALSLNQTSCELVKFKLSDLKPSKCKIETSSDCSNLCKDKKITKVNLTEKSCPQTFILSKLALEESELNTKILFSFKTEENALKTLHSLTTEGKVANWLGNQAENYTVISCN